MPEDIAVVGYDNSSAARNCIPPLASIDQNYSQLAEQAVGAILEQIKKIAGSVGKYWFLILSFPANLAGFPRQ